MTILIDAHNLLHQDKELAKIYRKNYTQAFEELVNMIGIYAYQNHKKKVYVIFDGFAPEIYPPFENMYVEESGRYQSADDLIKDYVRTSVNPKKLKIISSDRDILNFAKNQGSEIYRSEDFIHELRFIATKPVTQQEEEIYNKIKKEKRQKPLLDVFQSSELTLNELDDLHLDIPEEAKQKLLKSKSKKKKQTKKIENSEKEKLDLSKLKEHYSEKDSKEKKNKEQEKGTNEFDKINDLNERFSENEFKEMENWFK